jgi:hypothetical protein
VGAHHLQHQRPGQTPPAPSRLRLLLDRIESAFAAKEMTTFLDRQIRHLPTLAVYPLYNNIYPAIPYGTTHITSKYRAGTGHDDILPHIMDLLLLYSILSIYNPARMVTIYFAFGWIPFDSFLYPCVSM